LIHRFEKIIASNFESNPNSRKFFGWWGSRCYLIAGNYGYSSYSKGKTIHRFLFDPEVFVKLGGEYLISGYRIENAMQNRLKLIRYFPGEGRWSIWLYGCESSQAPSVTHTKQ
jgi:hypothetical protein